MSEKNKAALCLIVIAALAALAQTMDFNEQQQVVVAAPSAHYLAWKREMLRATEERERKEYIARWSEENPELAPIIATQWRSAGNARKVARP